MKVGRRIKFEQIEVSNGEGVYRVSTDFRNMLIDFLQEKKLPVAIVLAVYQLREEVPKGGELP